MGCAQSRVDNEESVTRCKDRKILMKEAVTARNAFASGHSGYAVSLKNTGAAISDFAHGEEAANINPPLVPTPHQQLDPTSQPHMDSLPPPPPPLPNFSPSPLKRSLTMPEFSAPKTAAKAGENAILEDENEESGGGEELLRRNRRNGGGKGDNLPPPPPPPTMMMGESKGGAWDYFFLVENMGGSSGMGEVEEGNVGGGVEPKTPEKVVEKGKEVLGSNVVETPPVPVVPVSVAVVGRGSKVGCGVSLLKLLEGIDDHFLKASESAQEVAKMLEANRLHYHSNFADNRGHIDHSARVMRVITWNRSFRGMPNGESGKDDFDAEEYETHATVLDKLLAWEKKLYEEVKAGELMKLEYQRKVALLNKQKKRGASVESLEKTKAAVSHLHTRYIVDMQSMDSTVSEVNDLRDRQLYPKLVALVDGMANMWEAMCMHHDNQLKIATDLKSLDIAHTPKETTKYHHERTIQLLNIVQGWHSQFEKLVTHQKQYIRALNSWLKLNLFPIESSLKEKISSPPRIQNPPIQALLNSWNDYLEKLPDELAKTAISSFAAVIKTIILHQEEEMKLKEKCDDTRKEFLRKNQAFEDWYQKYMQRRNPHDEMDPERGEDANHKDPISEKQFAVESLKKRLEEEVEDHLKYCLQVREKSLGSLKTRLPELFRAMSDYAHTCSDAYEQLRLIAHSSNQNRGPS